MERLRETMRAEFFTGADRVFATVAKLQEALDKWVSEDNTARPHQSCIGRPPAERFALADRSVTPTRALAHRHRLRGQRRAGAPRGRHGG